MAAAGVAVAGMAVGVVPAGGPLTAPPPARAAYSARTPIGGPSLAARGTVVGSGAPRLPTKITAAGWLVADLDTGDVPAARDPHGPYRPASTIKVLTALALLPRLPPARQVPVSDRDVAVDGSKVGLVPRARYSVAEFATAMLVASGNDAAEALAGAAGGDRETVRLMSEAAARLGARDTVVRDPTGLDAPGGVTSAYDLALIARAALNRPDIRRYVTVRRTTVRGTGKGSFEIQNHNPLLVSYPGCIGVKNGYTEHARATYIGAARRGGHTLLVVLLRADPRYAPEARALLDWGFAARGRTAPVGRLVEPGTAVTAAIPTPPAAVRPAPTPRRPARTGWLLPTGLGLAAAAVGWLTVRRRRRRPIPLASIRE